MARPVTAAGMTTVSGLAWQTIFVLASVVVTIILFTVLYKLLPNTHVPFTEALPGAVLAGVLWEGAKFGFSFLLPYFHYDLLYGSIGAAVAVTGTNDAVPDTGRTMPASPRAS